MIKFFGAFFITMAFLWATSEIFPDVHAMDRAEESKVFAPEKKHKAIKVPGESCIVSVEEKDQLFEQHIALCMNKHNWLNIGFVNKSADF